MSNLMNQINEVITDLQNNDADYKVILNTLIDCKEALAQPAQEPLTSLDEIFADEMFRLNRDIMPLPEHLIHEIAQRNYHPALGINPVAFTLDIEKAHGIGEQACKEALEQPAQKPVGYTEPADLESVPIGDTGLWFAKKDERYSVALYTHPAPSQWISVKDRFPEYLEGKDHSANVIGICKLSETHSYMGIFSLVIVDYTDDGHLWAWAKLDRCYGDLQNGECEFDDDYEITHWMPLPDAPKESNDD